MTRLFWPNYSLRKVSKFTNFLFIFGFALILVFWIVLQKRYNLFSCQKPVEEAVTVKLSKLPTFDKYVFASYEACSGIGNQMFRIASLFGIGVHLNRTPGFDAGKQCQKAYQKELEGTFPKMAEIVKFHEIKNDSETIYLDFGLDCCRFDDPKNIHEVWQKNLVLNGNYFQSYKYFDQFRQQIQVLFSFHPKIVEKGASFGRHLFQDDPQSHKLCIHVRRGDFIQHDFLETRADFLIPALKFVRSYLQKNGAKKISLVFLSSSNEDKFVASLNLDQSDFSKLHQPRLTSRSEEMCFGIQFCDSLLISASGSTFGFWIGYLMPQTRPIFYHGKVAKNRAGRYAKDRFDFDAFPKNWKMLELVNGTAFIDNRWFFEKFGNKNKIG